MGEAPPETDLERIEAARDELLLLDLGARRQVEAALPCVEALAASTDPLDVRYLVPLVFAERWKLRSKPDALGALAAASAKAVVALLGRVPAEASLAIDPAMRRPGYRLLGWKYFREWAGLGPGDVLATSSGDPTAALLGVVSTHPNGYVRALAVRELERSGPAALPWLLVRACDWALPVREPALEAVRGRIAPDHASALVECLPLLYRLRAQRSADHRALFAAVVALFAEHEALLREHGLAHPRAAVRRCAYRLAAERAGPSVDLLARALSDRDAESRLWAARHARALAPAAAERLAPSLLARRAGPVRRVGYALAARADLPGVDDLLRQGLDDASAASRHLCRFLLRERGARDDFAERYRRVVRGGGASPSVLRGLAELGRADDWELFVPYVDLGGAQARAAIFAMATLDRAASHELRLFLLGAPEPGVSAEAGRTLAGSIGAGDAEALDAHLRAERPHVRRHALRLAAYLPGWAAPIAILGRPRQSDHDAADEALRCWLARAWKSARAPSAAEAARVRALVEEAELGEPIRESMARLLAFVA